MKHSDMEFKIQSDILLMQQMLLPPAPPPSNIQMGCYCTCQQAQYFALQILISNFAYSKIFQISSCIKFQP